MQKTINLLKKSKSKEECLRKAYQILCKKYKGYRLLTYIRFMDLFDDDVGRLWKKSDFLHCDMMNYLLRILLIKSGKFKEPEIKPVLTEIWGFSPHQYLRVKVSPKKYIDVDIWGCSNGIKFGDHAHGFH